MSKKSSKIEYHIVRTSAQKLSVDLDEFSDDIDNCSDEQLHVIFSHFENIALHVERMKEVCLKKIGG
jgi:hypothetical protein